jgi:hypothetical protein
MAAMKDTKDAFAAALQNGAGKVEWMKIGPEEALYGIETLYMKKDYPDEPARAVQNIVEWFRNDTFVKPDFPEILRVPPKK